MYERCDTVLECITSENTSRIFLYHDLKWDHHTDQVSSKAAQKLGLIHRNLQDTPADCKKLAYIALVRSGIESASIIWDPIPPVIQTS